MKELLEAIARAMVNNPDQVQVRAVEAETVTLLELRVHPSDLGRVIGRQGHSGRFYPHYHRCGGHETAKARHGGNSEVEPATHCLCWTPVKD
jgi:hypothetical protein